MAPASSSLFAILAIGSSITSGAFAAAIDRRELSPQNEAEIAAPRVPLNSDNGQNLFFGIDNDVMRSTALSILGSFQTQQTQTYCGIATSATVLNSMGEAQQALAPLDPVYYPYSYYTQNSFFNSQCVLDVITVPTVMSIGVTLEQLTQMINCYAPKDNKNFAKGVHADTYKNVDDMRDDLVSAMNNPDARVLINYKRKQGGGHWSPLAAYSESEDMFLIADVSRYKYPPVWVPADEIYAAVNTIDTDANKTRGFIFVNDS